MIISLLQIGLAIQMHHHFGSKFLIDTLNSHGICSSYSEVRMYEKSAAVSQREDIPGYQPGRTVQFIAYYVDHNTCSIDGLNTFLRQLQVAPHLSLYPESQYLMMTSSKLKALIFSRYTLSEMVLIMLRTSLLLMLTLKTKHHTLMFCGRFHYC